MVHRVILSPTAVGLIRDVTDRRIRELIRNRIDGLATDPEKQGKPLLGELSGFRSIRAAGQRYRIIYRVEARRVVVFVVAAGIRKEGSRNDIYRLAKKLLRLGLLKP